jgi:ankyrin repeat protein
MFASTGPFPETVQTLLEYGSDANAADDFEGWTPIMFAAGEGQLEVIQVLLDHGADPSAVDMDGQVAADHAAANSHPEAETVLREAVH